MIILRRLRGVIATVLAWGLVWGLLGTGYFVGNTVWLDFLGRPMSSCSPLGFLVAPLLGIWGAASAVVYSTALIVAERGRAIGSLSAIRVAGWGALGGVTLPLVDLGFGLAHSNSMVPTYLAQALAVGPLLGAGCAAGALAIARRGEQPVGR
jgi:hypothetical protein